MARRVLEVSASGLHHVLLIGPEGRGSARLANLLPPLTPEHLEEASLVHRKAGLLEGDEELSGWPFRSPHHTISEAALMGNASLIGEVELARHGVLFLDQLTEFRSSALETLAQWVKGQETSRILLVGSMAGCPCGKLGCQSGDCDCLPAQIQAHRDRIPLALLDLFDLEVELPVSQISGTEEGLRVDLGTMSERVIACRIRQARRFRRHEGIESNGAMTEGMMDQFCRLDERCGLLLEKAFTDLRLDRQGRLHILKVARTIADLGLSDSIREDDLLEAISYRALDRHIWS